MRIKFLTTSQEQAKGLQYEDNLDSDTCLAFPDIYRHASFHMRNCNFPIEIAFLDQENKILRIAIMLPEIGSATAPENSVMAIEANIGFFGKNGFKEGNKFEYEPLGLGLSASGGIEIKKVPESGEVQHKQPKQEYTPRVKEEKPNKSFKEEVEDALKRPTPTDIKPSTIGT